MVDLFLAALGLLVLGLAAGAASRRHHRAHHPGARACACAACRSSRWSALVASIGLLLVLPVLLGALDLPVRRPPQRPGRCSAATSASASWIGFALTQPATYLFALPADRPRSPSCSRSTFRKRHADARRRLRRPRRSSASPPCRPSPSRTIHDLPWSGSGLDLDDFGDKLDDLVPYALFTLLPMLGVLIVIGDRRPRRPAADDAETGQARRHAGVRVRASSGSAMILVGMLGGALVPDRRPRPAGHRVRGRRRSSTSSTAPCSAPWAASPTGRRSCDGPHHRPTSRRSASPLLGVLAHRARLAAVLIAGFADQPAASRHVRLRRPGRAVERARHASATADGRRRAGLRRARGCVRPRRDGDADGRRRPVGRPDARVGDDVAGAARQLRRGPDGHVARAVLDLQGGPDADADER